MTVYNFTSVLVMDSVGGNVKVARRQTITATDPSTGAVAAGLTQDGQPVTSLVSDDTGHVTFASTQGVVRLTSQRGYWQDVTSRDLWSNILVGSVSFAADGEVSATKAVRSDDSRLANNVKTTRAVNTGAGLSGGGNLTVDRTLSVDFAPDGAGTSTQAVRGTDVRLARKAVNTGTGLLGGGLLDVDRTLSVDFAADGVTAAGKAVAANDVRLSGNYAPTLTANTDLDTLNTVSRTDYVQGSAAYTNRPVAGDNAILRTYYVSATVGFQFWQSISGTLAQWSRFRGSGGWSAWQRIDGPYATTQAVAQANAYTDSKRTRTDLDSWRTARDAAATAPARVVCFGDSRTEGTGTTDVSLRWQTLLQNHLRKQFGALTGATFPFIPAYPQTSAPGFGVTRSGNVTQNATYAFGGRAANLIDGTSTLTFTFTGDSFDVLHVRASATAVMAISIDGGAATVVNTNTTGVGGSSNAAKWSSPALARGSHTVTITRDASSAAGQNVIVLGLLTFDGDRAAGIRVIDSARHGSDSNFFTSSRNSTHAAAVAALGTVSLVVISMATNDTIGPTTPATYRANIEALIAALRTTGGFSGSVILLNLVKPNSITEAQYAPFAEQMAAIAAADNKVEYVDMRREMPDVPATYTDVAGQGLFNDGIHENNYGHALIAGKLAAILGS